MDKSAVISDCGRYRYRLDRSWNHELPALYIVMLNPSTADADSDDPTIRKCIGFSKINGYGSIVVFNLFALRATDPKRLISCSGFIDNVGPENDRRLATIPENADVLCAWGSFPYAQPRLWHRTGAIKRMLVGRRLLCVKKTEDRPWHPLYVKYGKLLELAPIEEGTK